MVIGIAAGMWVCTDSEEGALFVKITGSELSDTPLRFSDINLEITSVQVSFSDSGSDWTEIPTYAGVYSLVGLENKAPVLLAFDKKLPAGDIKRIRVVPGLRSYVRTSDRETFTLHIPGNYVKGIDLNADMTITPDTPNEALLNFDVQSCVRVGREGGYWFEPAVKVSVTHIR